MNKTHNVTIESIDVTGTGIARIDGKAVFVRDVLPGENVVIEIYKRKSNFDFGRLVEIQTKSPERIIPACENFGVCGGCSMQHLEFSSQVKYKEQVLIDNLKHIGKTHAEKILPPLYGEPWGYRYRARLSVKYVAKKGGVLVGFREKSSIFVADMNSCLILPKDISDLIPRLRELISGLSIKDKLPQIEVACSDKVNVFSFRILDLLTKEDEDLIKSFVDSINTISITELQIWLQPGKEDTLYQFYPENTQNNLSYSLPKFNITMPFLPSEFTQVNPNLNQEMVNLAINLLEIKETDCILDFFCGIGNFTLPIATKAKVSYGIEGADNLVKRATENAKLNNLEHKTAFTTMDLFKVAPDYLRDLGHYEKWLIDPPRDGAMELIKSITPEIAPQKIVYVSCNPATLARDADILCNTHGYKLKAAGVMNMFPHTSHIESIAVFELT